MPSRPHLARCAGTLLLGNARVGHTERQALQPALQASPRAYEGALWHGAA